MNTEHNISRIVEDEEKVIKFTKIIEKCQNKIYIDCQYQETKNFLYELGEYWGELR